MQPRAPKLRHAASAAAIAALTLSVVSCATSPESSEADIAFYALVQGIDGFCFYPPLGPEPTVSGPFEATLLDGLTVTIEAEDSAGVITPLASFDHTTRPAVALLTERERYWVNIPASTYLTDPSQTYRIRVLLDGAELGSSVMSPHVFEVLAYNPALPIGVHVRIEGTGAVRTVSPDRQRRHGSPAHCADGVRNKDETGVDCGGAGCAACPTCADGIQNQGEVGVDCGGPCLACPTCADGIQNQGEVGVDCGGPCAACVPVPVLTAISPSSAFAGYPAFTMTLTGESFVDRSYATFGGVSLATTFVSSTELTASVTAAMIANAGTLDVAVVTPAPSGGTSGSLPFVVNLAGSAPVSLAAGWHHTCVARVDGHVHCQGTNTDLQLGDDSLTDAVQVGAGQVHTCARRRSGLISCWGNGGGGKFGDGRSEANYWSERPVNAFNSAVEMSVGGSHTCARRSNGEVWCWGPYTRPVNSTALTTSLVAFQQAITSATQISAGQVHTCALRSNRTISCWGLNSEGQLGDGTTTTRAYPTPVPGITTATQVLARGQGTCALLQDGTVWCWGYNGYGQFGGAIRGGARQPIRVTEFSNVVSISGGDQVTCARFADGTLHCLGSHLCGSTAYPALPTNLIEIAGSPMTDWNSCRMLARNADGTIWLAGPGQPNATVTVY